MFVDEAAELAAEVGAVAHSAVPVAHNGLRDERGEIVVVLPAHTLDRDCDVSSWHRIVPYPHLRADEVGLVGDAAVVGRGLGVRVRGGHAGEVLLGQLDELSVRNAAGTDEHHAVGGIIGLNVGGQVIARDAQNVLLRAEDGAAKRLVLEGRGMQVVEDDLLHLLVDFLLLAQDDVAFALDGRSLQLAVLQDVGEDVDSGRNVIVEGLGVVDRVLARRVGVEVPAHVLDFQLELRLRALLRALERQMLKEVGGAVGLVRLCARAGVDPDAYGRRLGVGGVLGGDLSGQLMLSANLRPVICLP